MQCSAGKLKCCTHENHRVEFLTPRKIDPLYGTYRLVPSYQWTIKISTYAHIRSSVLKLVVLYLIFLPPTESTDQATDQILPGWGIFIIVFVLVILLLLVVLTIVCYFFVYVKRCRRSSPVSFKVTKLSGHVYYIAELSGVNNRCIITLHKQNEIVVCIINR